MVDGVPRCRAASSAALLLLALLCGCADLAFREASFERPFRFETDSFAFANELIWSYDFDAEGTWRGSPHQPQSGYTHRCFVLARSARQFFQHARFEPALPVPDDAELRERVRRVVRTSPRRRLPERERVVIPGFASLRELSRGREELLKDSIGGPVWSYVERGNWRMVIPFSRRHQADTARRLAEAIDQRRPPIVHLVRFPHITINHAVLLYAYREAGRVIHFEAYDPNAPDAPATLSYDPATRRFSLPRNTYFSGGHVDVYEIYHRPWY
jgi:hypothetical protein